MADERPLPARVLVSACLMGEPVRYHGGDAACAHPALARWREEGRLVPFCPEVAGGLPVPRPAAEVEGGDARRTLAGTARVRTAEGRDVTAHFVEGARRALAAALESGVVAAVLKDGSPSCATRFIHDGSFAGRRVPGSGLAALLLADAGIRVFSELEIDEAERWLAGRAP